MCAEGLKLIGDIANIIGTYGGACLIIDYGKNHPISNSLRVIYLLFII